MILEIYDLECLTNFFSYVGYVPKEDKWYEFVISPWRNDYEELVKHLKRDKLIQVGLNIAPSISNDSSKREELLEACDGNQQPSTPLTKCEGSETNS